MPRFESEIELVVTVSFEAASYQHAFDWPTSSRTAHQVMDKVKEAQNVKTVRCPRISKPREIPEWK